MRSFILRILKSLKVKLVVYKTEIHSFLTFLRLDFMDVHGKFYTFEIFYNETDFFSKELKLIGDSKSNPYGMSDSIRSCCTLIGSNVDYREFERPVPTKEDLDDFFETQMQQLVDDLIGLDYGEFIAVKTIDFYTRPTLILMVQFNVKGKRVKPLKIFIGEEITYNYKNVKEEDRIYVKNFINQVRLNLEV